MEILLLVALAALCVQVHFLTRPAEPPRSEMVLRAEQGAANMALRNADFPHTFIRFIEVDLTSPDHGVRLTWAGPQAGSQETGPFHSSPGRGTGNNDCNDVAESNRGGSNCTPKGTKLVEGFSDAMPSGRGFKFVTWFHSSREISFHSHPTVPNEPVSHGCVRLDAHAAQLIHNNALVGQTEVVVDGTWTPPQKTE